MYTVWTCWISKNLKSIKCIPVRTMGTNNQSVGFVFCFLFCLQTAHSGLKAAGFLRTGAGCSIGWAEEGHEVGCVPYSRVQVVTDAPAPAHRPALLHRNRYSDVEKVHPVLSVEWSRLCSIIKGSLTQTHGNLVFYSLFNSLTYFLTYTKLFSGFYFKALYRHKCVLVQGLHTDLDWNPDYI